MPEHYPAPGSRMFQMKAAQYRVRAEELSAIGAQFREDRTRVTLQNLAEEYRKMAEQMDALSEIEARLGPRRANS